MHPTIRRVFNAQQSGLILVILLLGAILTIFAGSHIDRMTRRHSVNNFLNFYTLHADGDGRARVSLRSWRSGRRW